MNNYKSRMDINSIKKELSKNLMEKLREDEDRTIKELIYGGYSYDEIMDIVTNYEQASGLDLINCNEITDKALTKS